MSFVLKDNNTELQFSTDGGVQSSGAAAGTWSVDGQNQIVLNRADGSSRAFPVGWSFIDNQLWLIVNGSKHFNFHSLGFPDYRVVGNQIVVSPRLPTSPFTFTLAAQLSLDENLDLVLNLGGATTKIIGTLEDTKGQFIYRFTDKALGAEDALIFSGEWQRNPNIEGEIQLNFVYKIGAQAFTIAIPKAFDVNPFTNSLRLRYEKEGKMRSLELAGELQFRGNSTLVFSVRKSGGNGKSEIEVAVRLNGTGTTIKSLDLLVLKKKDADGSQTIQVGGTLEAKVGSTSMVIGFSYAKMSGGSAASKVDLAVNGKFQTKNGTIVFEYKKTGGGTTFSVVARDIQVGPVSAILGTQIIHNGQQKSVRAFIGLTF